MATETEHTGTPKPPAAAVVVKPVSHAGVLPQDASSQAAAPADNAGHNANTEAGQLTALYSPDLVAAGSNAYFLQANQGRIGHRHSDRNPERNHLKNFFGKIFGHSNNGVETETAAAPAPAVRDTAPHARDHASMKVEAAAAVAVVPVAAPAGIEDDLAYLDAHRTANTDLSHLDRVKFVPALAGLVRALEKKGFDVQAISMYRSPEKQRQTIRENTAYDPATGREYMIRPTASEYGSEHVVGAATDLQLVGAQKYTPEFLAALDELAPQFGLKTIPGRKDPGHVGLADMDYVQQLREKFGFTNNIHDLVYHKPKTSPLHTALDSI